MNTRIGLIIVYLSFSVPYAVWMLVGFFKTVPLGIEEAARVDGANKFQTFTKIVLPLVMPGIVATLVVIPSVIFFMFIQNKIAGGMTDGAVK